MSEAVAVTPTRAGVESLFLSWLGRLPNDEELARASTDDLVLTYHLLAGSEHIRLGLAKVLELHLLLLHAARVKLVSTMLPQARQIVDLGGANGTLYDMGYPYPFEQLTVVDLPPEDRCDMYKDLKLAPRLTAGGPIVTLFANMTQLSAIGSHSVDLVWSGQSIEHITEEDAGLVYAEIRRILKPQGFFCLDTPNRLLTDIHVNGQGWIHPEHKIEYRPAHLQRNLRKAGFLIEQALGVTEMVNTHLTGNFDYRDFLLGAGLSTNVDACYIQYYRCRVA